MQNKNKNITDSLDKLGSIFEKVEECLNEWTEDKNLQFSQLLQLLTVKAGLDPAVAKSYDPLVRFYVRNHTDWKVTLGAHGGIMRADKKTKKEQKLLNKASKKKVESADKSDADDKADTDDSNENE